jgi:tetratricopeptide (TPR) repeat protein
MYKHQPCSWFRFRFLQFALTVLALTPPSSSIVGQAPAVNTPPPKSEMELKMEPIIGQAKQEIAAGRWDAAIATCKKAIELEPKYAASYLLSGIAKDGKGEFDEAMKDLELALAQSPRDTAAIASRADAFYQKASMFYKRGELLKTIDNAYFAILEKNNHVEAHCIRALAYLERQQFDKAIQSADRAISVDANNAQAYRLR